MKLKEERKELEKMLESAPQEINNNVPNLNDNIPGIQVEPVTNVDFVELRKKCQREARAMLKNAIKFIITEEDLKDNKYLKDKLKVDTLSLAGMIYQLRTNEIMQKALIDQVNLGMVQARMFEVFATMSKTIGDLNKQLVQTVEALKETYKTFKQDAKDIKMEVLGPSDEVKGILTTGNGGVVTRGTKELINKVKENKKIIDVSIIDDNSSLNSNSSGIL